MIQYDFVVVVVVVVVVVGICWINNDSSPFALRVKSTKPTKGNCKMSDTGPTVF